MSNNLCTLIEKIIFFHHINLKEKRHAVEARCSFRSIQVPSSHGHAQVATTLGDLELALEKYSFLYGNQ